MFNLTGSQKTKISFLIHLLGKRLQYGYYLVWVTVDGSVTISFVAILYYPLQFYKCIIFTRNIFAIRVLKIWAFGSSEDQERYPEAFWKEVWTVESKVFLRAILPCGILFLSKYIPESKKSEKHTFSWASMHVHLRAQKSITKRLLLLTFNHQRQRLYPILPVLHPVSFAFSPKWKRG